jgi:nitrite reductase (NADH) large subunit
MIVCHCRGISERRILEVIREGCSTVCAVAEACGAGTSCGGCVPLVCEIVENERETLETLGMSEHGTLRRAS